MILITPSAGEPWVLAPHRGVVVRRSPRDLRPARTLFVHALRWGRWNDDAGATVAILARNRRLIAMEAEINKDAARAGKERM